MTREELLTALDVGANLAGADLTWIDLRGADLAGADLTEAYMRNANLTGANLAGARMRRTDLTRAVLDRADLVSADLRGASLTDSGLALANLIGADLRGACLTRAFFEETRGVVSATGIGSVKRAVYAWLGPDGWTVQAGCWEGTTAQLRERVAGNPWRAQPDKDVARWTAQYVAFCDMVDAQDGVAP